MRASGLLLFLSAVALVPGQDAPKPTEDPAIAAVRKRQELIKTLKVTFKRTDHLVRGAQSELLGGRASVGEVIVPDKDMTLESENAVLIDQKKFRYTDNHPTFYFPSGALIQKQQIGVTDTTVAKTLISHPGSKMKTMGMVDGTAISAESKSPELSPLVLFARPLEPTMGGYPFGRFKPAGGGSIVDGVECKEYVHASGKTTVHLWLDPVRGHVALRRHIRREGVTAEQTDIQYGPHPVAGLFPTGWTSSRFNSQGGVLRTIQVAVGTSVVNEPIPAAEFTLEFPPGSRYQDRRTGKEYHVREDGSRWEVDPSNRNPPVPAPTSWWAGWYLWLLVPVVLFGVVCWFRWRKRE